MKDSSLPTSDGTNNQMWLVDLRQMVSDADSLEDALAESCGLWEALYDRMDADEILWVVAPSEYRDGRMWPVAMAAADYARNESKLVLKNTITLHRWYNRDGDMESAYLELLFFVRDKHEYQFHKNRIRVAHVYKGHEWGGERKEDNSAYHNTKVQRYNPDGKDPGNIWLEEIRTQTNDQSVDETRPLSLTEAIRRCVLVGSDEGDVVYIIGNDDDFTGIVAEERREVELMDMPTLCAEVNK